MTLDEAWPPRGPCGLCGHADARHRIWDVIGERHRAGDSIESLAQDYRVPREAVELAIEWEATEGGE